MYQEELNHNQSMSNRQGLKESKVHARVNQNPSEASSGDTLVIRMPQLMPNSIIYPNSLNLTYNYKLATGEDETSFPDPLSSAIIDQFKMTLNS